MRLVLQRVSEASVQVDAEIIGKIGQGWLVLIGVHADDDMAAISHMLDKLLNLRAFNDADGKMNLSVRDIQGELLLVSQFTLYADCRKGRRPSFTQAARPEHASSVYTDFVHAAKQSGLRVATGQFGADMKVDLRNDGPVTLILSYPVLDL
jgi:D-tyrosyl-tRNA(Tyr) deacylase